MTPGQDINLIQNLSLIEEGQLVIVVFLGVACILLTLIYIELRKHRGHK